ncbi:MAG: extracellular solute-binding protein [Planctomycetota bacterium]|jgi:iron(III) transport system substrate-binding protein
MRRTCLILLLVVAGCDSKTEEADGKSPMSVVVYTALDRMFSEPVLQDFEKQTGIDVQEKYDSEKTKTTGLVNELIELKEKPRADVFWNNEIMQTIRLVREGVTQPYKPSTASDIPEGFRDPEGHWVGFAARARVILINTDLIRPEDAPKSIFDLTKPEYKGMVVVAKPLFGTTATHVAVLFAEMGPEKAKKYLTDLKGNDVVVAGGNAMARNMVMTGEYPICMTDTDDANGAFLKNMPVRMIYPDQDGIGTLVIPNTVTMIKGCPHPEEAKRLIDYIASTEVEAKLAKLPSAQMPLRKGIESYSDQFNLDNIRTMKVDWKKAAEMHEQSARFVQETFLR